MVNFTAILHVFVFAFIIVLINIVSVVFPSLIVVLLDDLGDDNPFELGTWAVPVIITNIAILIFGVLYFTKKLPKIVNGGIHFIKNFETSKNITMLILIGLVFAYIGYALHQLPVDESISFGDVDRVIGVVDNWPIKDPGDNESLYILHVKNFFLKTSDVLFQNYRVMPLIISMSLLLLTYFFTVEITKKRFAGIVAFIILFQSNTFQSFDTLASYENSWTLLYLLSLFLIEKKWFLSPVSFVASLFSKPLTAVYLPMTLFYTYCSQIPQRKKFYTFAIYISIAVVGIIGLYVIKPDVGFDISGGGLGFDYIDFWSGFTTWSYQLRFETIFLLFILPLTVGLFYTARNGIPHASSILGLISGIIILMPLMAALTDYNIHPYRYVPLMVFFSIGVGMLLSKKALNRPINSVD
jgi:hypothetical protein